MRNGSESPRPIVTDTCVDYGVVRLFIPSLDGIRFESDLDYKRNRDVRRVFKFLKNLAVEVTPPLRVLVGNKEGRFSSPPSKN